MNRPIQDPTVSSTSEFFDERGAAGDRELFDELQRRIRYLEDLRYHNDLVRDLAIDFAVADDQQQADAFHQQNLRLVNNLREERSPPPPAPASPRRAEEVDEDNSDTSTASDSDSDTRSELSWNVLEPDGEPQYGHNAQQLRLSDDED